MVIRFLSVLTALSILQAGSVLAADQVKLTSQADYTSYSVGYQMGTDFKKQGWEIKPEAMLKGVQDAIAGTTPMMSDEKMKSTLAAMKRNLLAAQEKAAIDYRKASDDFLKENAQKEGVVVLPSGVQYKILEEGTGKTPTLEDTVRVHFKLFKVDGTEIGSTYSNSDPRVVPLKTALPGLKEVLVLMKEGARVQIVLPRGVVSNRENDDRGAAIYDLHLISIKPKT
jgi:FKBP-type peptidyl-prolyl cis-trans isomerase FklB